MIDRAVALLTSRLNAYLQARIGTGEDVAVATALTDASGAETVQSRNRISLFVVNLAQDTMPKIPHDVGKSARGAVQNRPLFFNIHLMVAANFDAERYDEALKRLSLAMLYFQGHTLFNAQNTPEMSGSGLDRLTVEVETLDMTTTSHLWGILGGRYVPSVLYRVRAAIIDADALIAETPRIHELDPKVKSGGS